MVVTKIPKTRREREVWEACDELWEELREDGLSVSELTGEKIKAKLVHLGYSRGNPKQIYQYRNSWQLSRNIDENEDLVSEERSAALSEKVQKSVELLFKEIQVEADEKITRAKNEFEDKLKDFSSKCEAVNRESEVLRNRLDGTIDELNSISHINLELSSKLNEEKHQHEITKEKLNGVEARHRQFEINAERRESLLNERSKKEHDDAQIRIDNLIAVHKKEISDLKEHSENQRYQYIVESENLKVANSKLEKQLEKITLLEQKTNNNNNELRQSIRILEEELGLFNKMHNDLIQKSHDIEKVLSETKGELKQLQILLVNQKNDYQNANKQLLDYKEKVGRLEEKLCHAQIEIKKMDVKKK